MPEEGFAGEIEARRGFESRLAVLQSRVNAAALALHERNVRPTVARIRAALGGGSPNEVAPALRRWKDGILPTLTGRGDPESASGVPPLIADLVSELWSRATAAAVVEVKGGSAARQVVTRTEEAQALREQVNSLRDQLQRESLAYGELRAQSARHEAIARETLGRVREAEVRERDLLHELGDARQHLAEFAATIEQLRTRPVDAAQSPSRQKKRSPAKRSTAKPKARRKPAMRPRPKAVRRTVQPPSRRSRNRRR